MISLQRNTYYKAKSELDGFLHIIARSSDTHSYPSIVAAYISNSSEAFLVISIRIDILS